MWEGPSARRPHEEGCCASLHPSSSNESLCDGQDLDPCWTTRHMREIARREGKWVSVPVCTWHVCVCVCVCACMSVYVCVCVWVYMCVCVWVYMCVGREDINFFNEPRSRETFGWGALQMSLSNSESWRRTAAHRSRHTTAADTQKSQTRLTQQPTEDSKTKSGAGRVQLSG